MKQELPHITVGQIEADPFAPSERSKTVEHADRLRSNIGDSVNFENFQNSMKNNEIKS